MLNEWARVDHAPLRLRWTGSSAVPVSLRNARAWEGFVNQLEATICPTGKAKPFHPVEMLSPLGRLSNENRRLRQGGK